MQIVRDLGGFSLGRSDLLRRAMSKKKLSVMEKERRTFVYGNEEEGVNGCIKNGISEQTANKIYEEMIDFAKYAFNKSHAAAYAVVSYQTAYLKHYYPVEYMAALLTSVIDNINKITGYVLSCRQLGISILPPDINEGEWGFSVSGNGIRYGLSAIKGVGRNVVDAIVLEREEKGAFKSLKDFIYRLSNKEVNKRTVENFIKSGAFDSLPGNRKQKMAVYAEIIDKKAKDGKTLIAGQMSLFDLMIPSEVQVVPGESFVPSPEFEKEKLLGFEKEVLGIYISGHPLDAWQSLWEKEITATTMDFMIDEEIQMPAVKDGTTAIIGGIVSELSVKFTKHNQRMAFIQLEDLAGTVEVVVFPRDFEKNEKYLKPENKVFIRGRVSVSEETAAKLICERITLFEEIPRQIWLQFQDLTEYEEKKQKMTDILTEFSGNSPVIVYLSKVRAKKILPARYQVTPNQAFLSKIHEFLGEENVKVVDMPIEKRREMN